MTKATISLNPTARFWNEPERVETIEIGHSLVAIQQLAKLSEIVNANPRQYDEMSQAMAYLIRIIAVAIMPSDEVRARIAQHLNHR